jgi:hypothetical protein
MKCAYCYQHNPPERTTCWNCGAQLRTEADEAASRRTPGSGSPADATPGADDTSELGTLGPLRIGEGAPPEQRLASRRPTSQPSPEYGESQFLVRSVVAGAMTGATAVGLLFGVLAGAASGMLEVSGISRNATVLVSIAQGIILGGVNGAIIGALSAYYGGGWWTGARVGGALAAGTWLIQALIMGSIAAMPAHVAAAAVLVLSALGAGIGALIGIVVDSISPRQY